MDYTISSVKDVAQLCFTALFQPGHIIIIDVF